MNERFKLGDTIHLALNIILPFALLLIVQSGLVALAVAVVFLSKWRILAVQPRHWLANIRANSIDIIVALASVVFMNEAETGVSQFMWAAWYAAWLNLIKPRSDTLSIGGQALIGQFLGLSALFNFSVDISPFFIVLGAWFVGYTSAYHFLSNYEEPLLRTLSTIWAFFTMQMAWLLNTWLLTYLFVPQIALIMSVLGYVVATIYHHFKHDNLRATLLRQYVIFACVILVLLILVADWSGEA